jgi:hypothetical protein
MKDCLRTLVGALILATILVMPAYSAEMLNSLLSSITG